MTATGSIGWVGELAQQHLDAAYNLGRWLLGNDQDAADAVHDAYLRAARAAQSYAGGSARAWWLAIVRNCCLAKLSTRRRETTLRSGDVVLEAAAATSEVEEHAAAAQFGDLLREQLRALPPEFREALVLREIEDLSYREIADVLGVPIGTVMSRLARGRALLQRAWNATAEETNHGM